MEHAVYLAAYSGSKELRRLLSHQLVLEGETEGGVKFRRPGGRASGDFNTGMGNTLIMLAVTVGVLKTFGCQFDVLVDGDNALVFLPGVAAGRVFSGFTHRALEFSGHEMQLEKPVTVLEQIRFGQSAPISIGHGLGFTMVREPLKVLSGLCASHVHLREEKFGRRWLHGVARCELSLARGVPVLQAAALKLLRTTDSRKQVPADRYREYFYLGAWLAEEKAALPVSDEARASYEKAFGVTPDEQLSVEKSLRGLGRWPEQLDDYPVRDSWLCVGSGVFDTFWESTVW
jgi:hypothetical protein